MLSFRIMLLVVSFTTMVVVNVVGQGGTTAPSKELGPSQHLKERETKKADKNHEADALNMVLYCVLLTLVVVTVWAFKHKRVRFLHETGLAIIYGLLAGVIIKYATSPSDLQRTAVNATANSSIAQNVDQNNPPEILRLQFDSKHYDYELLEEQAEKVLESKASFDPEIFFNIILPPIIFNAGYSMKRRHFFKNFGAITAFAFVGTTISAFAVGGVVYGFTRLLTNFQFTFTDSLFFGSLISATDPVTVLAIFSDLNVDVDLYAMVFGESVLNDAVAIVLAKSIEDYAPENSQSTTFDAKAFFIAVGNFVKIFIGAFGIGTLFGVITALLTKFTRIRDFPLLETAVFLLTSYTSYQLAEVFGLTGIVAVLFCGITQAHYTYNNLSHESKGRTKQLFQLLNFLMESFVFTYIGVTAFTRADLMWELNTLWFVLAAIVGIFIGRALNVYPLSGLLNLGRKHKIGYNFQHMMMFSGLRGAVAFALASKGVVGPARRMMLTATLIIVIITVIFCGGLTMQMLFWLKIRVGVEDEAEPVAFQAVSTRKKRDRRNYQTLDEPNANQDDDELLQRPEETTPVAPRRIRRDKAWLVQQWHNIDSRFVKPLLTHSRPTLEDTLPAWAHRIAALLTTVEQRAGTEMTDSDDELILDDEDIAFGDHSNPTTPTSEEPRPFPGHSHLQMPVEIPTVSAEMEDSRLGDLGLGLASANRGDLSDSRDTEAQINGNSGNRV